MMAAAAATGVDRVEIYTEPYASAWGTPRLNARARARPADRAAPRSRRHAVNAGHDLEPAQHAAARARGPRDRRGLDRHALIADALYLGLAETMRRYVRGAAAKRSTRRSRSEARSLVLLVLLPDVCCGAAATEARCPRIVVLTSGAGRRRGVRGVQGGEPACVRDRRDGRFRAAADSRRSAATSRSAQRSRSTRSLDGLASSAAAARRGNNALPGLYLPRLQAAGRVASRTTTS